MPSDRRITTATNALRAYADWLNTTGADSVRKIRNGVDQGRVPTEAWGVLLQAVLPPMPGPGERKTEVVIGASTEAAQALVTFKQTYEQVHEEAMNRLNELASIYEGTANTLTDIANGYDRNTEENVESVNKIDTGEAR